MRSAPWFPLDALGDRDHPLLRALEAMLDEHAAEAPEEDGKKPRRARWCRWRRGSRRRPLWTTCRTSGSRAWRASCCAARGFYSSRAALAAAPTRRRAPTTAATVLTARATRATRSGRGAGGRSTSRGTSTRGSQRASSDWRATPRRTILLLWLWLADVTVDRSPMMVCPASHLPIAAANEAHGAPHLPHAGGAPYRKEDGSIVQGYLPYGFERSQLREPQPLLAKRGQVTALTTRMYHTSSPNFGARTTA